MNVTIEYDKAQTATKGASLSAVVFGEEDPVVLDTEVQKKEQKIEGVKFETDSVAMCAIVETTLEKTVLASDGHNYKVTVACGEESGIPKDASLSVEEIEQGSSAYESYVANTETALGMEKGSAKYIRLFDIKILDKDGNKLQPAKGSPVDVKIKLADSGSENFSVVHFADKDDQGSVIKSETDGQGVSFEADGFSVYAVVEPSSGLDESRMTLNFYNGETLLASVIVKNGDDTDEVLEQIIYDPGAGTLNSGELFKGWILDKADYTTDDVSDKMDIVDIRAWAKTLTKDNLIKEGDVHNFYAMIYKTYAVTFRDADENGTDNGVTIHSDALIFKASEGSVSYEVNQSYTPKIQDADFQGWYWTSPNGSGVKFKETTTINGTTYNAGDVWPQTVPIPNNTEVEIADNVVFSPNVPKGYWLSFNENGKGASYTPPQFIPSAGDTVTEEPTAPTRFGYTFGGWYTDAACTAGNEFDFGSKLSGRTDVYAKWTPVSTAQYNVIIWQEKSSDTYANNVGDGKKRNYDFVEAITLSGPVGSVINTVRESDNQVTDGDDKQYHNAVVNGDTKSYTGYHCAGFDTNVTIVPEGTSVVNVYYDRNIVNYTFYYPYSDGYAYTPTTSTSGTQYGLVDGQYRQLTYRQGDYWHDTGWYYGGGWVSWGNIYTGTRYTRTYTGNVGWQEYQKETGLYGEKLNWPTDNTIWWYPEGYNNGDVDGTRMTYKNDFIPLDSDMTVEYYGVTGSGSQQIRFYTQDLTDPNHYTLQYSVTASNVGMFSVNDKFTGFHAYQTRSYTNGYYGGGSWSNWANVGRLNPSTGIYGNGVAVNDILEIRYNRIKNTIAFMDGSYFSGNGVRMDEENRGKLNETGEYYYESDLTSYNVGGSDYYTPEAPVGFAFDGWYADKTCTQPYNFTTMPVSGVTVYAKWVQKQYRVFLHPNVPESDTSLGWGQTNQQMNFRVDYGDKINGGNQIKGERTDYELIGWYSDEACTQPFNFDAYVLNDTTVTAAYDKTVDMTDEMNKYGNIVNPSEASNSDVDRSWITNKLDLYAKWRSKIVGAPGINVQYDAVEGQGSFTNGKTIHMDPLTYYLDRAESTAQPASTPTDNTKQFMYWVVQRWDEAQRKYVDTDEHVYPGDAFEVKKAYAHEEDFPDSTDPAITKKYTVQLRAEYEDKDAPTPTHIWWFPNDVAVGMQHEATEADNSLQINQAVPIPAAPEREGYKFLGWARVDEHVSESRLAEGADMPTGKGLKLTKDDLFLTYHEAEGSEDAYYTAIINGTPRKVSNVAADETLPYHDMYAVWAKSFTVTVKKVVDSGISADKQKEFSFTRSSNYDGTVTTEGFKLKDYETFEEVKTFTVLTGTTFNVTEANPGTDFEVKVSGTYVDEDGKTQTIANLQNGTNLEIQGDTELTYTNMRKGAKVKILKVDSETNSPLPGATFQLSRKVDGRTVYEAYGDPFTIENEGAYYEKVLPSGEYRLEETFIPAGYIVTADTTFTVHAETGATEIITDVTGDASAGGTNKSELTVKNAPGEALPHTGGSGTSWFTAIGLLLILGAGAGLLLRRRKNA